MINVLNLFVTHKCNLECSFCFSKNARERHQFTNKDNIRINNKSTDIDLIRYCGGEPLEDFDFLKELILDAKAPELSVNTNANKLTIDMVNFFNDNNIMVQISVDGYDRGERPLLDLDIKLINKINRLGFNQLLFYPEDAIKIYNEFDMIELYEVGYVNWQNTVGIPLEISHLPVKLKGINYFIKETTTWHHSS